MGDLAEKHFGDGDAEWKSTFLAIEAEGKNVGKLAEALAVAKCAEILERLDAQWKLETRERWGQYANEVGKLARHLFRFLDDPEVPISTPHGPKVWNQVADLLFTLDPDAWKRLQLKGRTWAPPPNADPWIVTTTKRPQGQPKKTVHWRTEFASSCRALGVGAPRQRNLLEFAGLAKPNARTSKRTKE